MLVATAFAFVSYRVQHPTQIVWLDIGFVLVETIFLATSRDTLAKYYARSQQLLAHRKSDSH